MLHAPQDQGKVRARFTLRQIMAECVSASCSARSRQSTCTLHAVPDHGRVRACFTLRKIKAKCMHASRSARSRQSARTLHALPDHGRVCSCFRLCQIMAECVHASRSARSCQSACMLQAPPDHGRVHACITLRQINTDLQAPWRFNFHKARSFYLSLTPFGKIGNGRFFLPHVAGGKSVPVLKVLASVAVLVALSR
jgi:hypothetical protein